MMSKSEYARLNLTMPDVVKVIREQVLEEAKQACKAELPLLADGETYGCIRSIENLKNK